MTAFINTCAHCGADYVARQPGRSRFCSDAHRVAYGRAREHAAARHAQLVTDLLRQRSRSLAAEIEAEASALLRGRVAA